MASINTTEGRAAREARINELFQLCKQLSSFDMENLEKEEARLRKEITADDRKKEEEKLRNNAQEHPTKAAYYELLLDKWSLSGDDSDAVSNTWMEWYFGPELMELISTPMETVENPKDDERSPKTLKGDKTESEAKEESDQAGEKASQSESTTVVSKEAEQGRQQGKGKGPAKKEPRQYVPYVGDWQCNRCGFWNIKYCTGCQNKNPEDGWFECYGLKRDCVAVQEPGEGIKERRLRAKYNHDWTCKNCRNVWMRSYHRWCSRCGGSDDDVSAYMVEEPYLPQAPPKWPTNVANTG